MTPKLIQAVEIGLQIPEVRLKLSGKSGTGKTMQIGAISKRLNYHLWPVVASTCDTTDARGIPFPSTDHTYAQLLPVGAAFREILLGQDKSQTHVMFLDEWSNTPPSVEAAFLKVIDEGILGDYQLPMHRLRFIFAENPAHIAANGHPTSPPLANRVCHLDWETSYAEWIKGTLQGWPETKPTLLPNNWREEFLPAAKRHVCSYIGLAGQELDNQPDDPVAMSKAWPSQRTWTKAILCHAACKAAGVDDDIRLMLVTGFIGDAAATKFFAWERDTILIATEDILADPSLLKGIRADHFHAQICAMSAYFASQPSQGNWKKFGPVLNYIIKTMNQKDMAVLLAKDILKLRPQGVQIWEEVKQLADTFVEAGIFARS